jgi:lambda repressor-like predicted transcriptional regulator
MNPNGPTSKEVASLRAGLSRTSASETVTSRAITDPGFNRLAAVMKERGITDVALSKRSGIAVATIRYIRGIAPNYLLLPTRLALAEALGVDQAAIWPNWQKMRLTRTTKEERMRRVNRR